MISFSISEKAKALLKRMRVFPGKEIAKSIDLQNELTIGHIQSKKLSQRGPFTLGVVTGRLRRSVRRAQSKVLADRVLSAIGTNVRYGGVHEFGYSGAVNVKQHVRHGGAGDRFLLGGKVITAAFARRIDPQYRKKLALAASGWSVVKAHQRTVNIRPRRMFQTGVAERAEDYGRAISEAIVKAWEGR